MIAQRQTRSRCAARLAQMGWTTGSLALLLVSCQAAPPPAATSPAATSSAAPTPTATSPATPTPAATSPTQPNPAPSASGAAESKQYESKQYESKQYESKQADFSFTYPADFVIADSPISESDRTLTLNLWQQQIYDAIAAGKYEGGTEYPPNVQVIVDRNPDRLFLKDWVERQPDRFPLPAAFEEHSIADRNGLSFRSTGLYEQQNVVFASADMETVIVISLATIGVPAADEPNRRAFGQILDSIQSASAMQP